MKPQLRSLVFRVHRRASELLSPAAKPTLQEHKIVPELSVQCFQRRQFRSIFSCKHIPSLYASKRSMTQVRSLVFKVHRQAPELISSAKPTPQEVKIVSDIDNQTILRSHYRLIFFYKHNPSMMSKLGNNDPVSVIREAIAKTLVYYYPFSGRLREGPDRKLMVECNNEGVMFVEADADVTLDEFEDTLRPPFPCVEELYAEGSSGLLNSPLLRFQVTRLKCGSFIVAVSFNHVMCDGTGLCMFLKTLGELVRGANSPSVPPVWDRHLLTARVPMSVRYAHREYDEFDAEMDYAINPCERMVQRSFSFSSKDINVVRKLVPSNLHSRTTTYELLASLLWRCRTIALKPLQNTKVRFITVMNARPLIHSALAPRGYYGNVFVAPVAITTAKELSERPLEFALRLIQEAKYSVTDEYVRSMIDLLALRGGPNIGRAWTYILSDLRRIKLDDIDFGWGKAIYASIVESYNGISFLVSYMNKKGNTEIVVPIILPASAMEIFSKELALVIGK